jgi:hypothetical protein
MLSVAVAQPAAKAVLCPQPVEVLSAGERGQIERGLKELNDRLARLRANPSVKPDHVADAEIYAKGIAWALRYDETLTAADGALLRRALGRGRQRAAALEAGKQPWREKKGKVVRAFRSALDDAVQPYGIIVPAKYDPAKPIRLDVVLHGSSGPVGMSELRFLSRFDEGDAAGQSAPERDYLELHPLGRVDGAESGQADAC